MCIYIHRILSEIIITIITITTTMIWLPRFHFPNNLTFLRIILGILSIAFTKFFFTYELLSKQRSLSNNMEDS